MSTATSRPQLAAAGWAANARGLLRLVYTHNPFYVISAWFVFTGLRVSFDPQGKLFDTTALMSSLAGYTLLLAGTAWLLIRLGQVWEDVRSLLILIVLMFMALSVVSDDILAKHVGGGWLFSLGGLLFATVVSESLLRGMKMTLPAAYRIPYYLLLGLLFLYPPALVSWAQTPVGPAMQWGLFAFPTVAGAVFLMLLPAIRRGAAYVHNNGTPWHWPWYPCVLFATLGLGICLRAYYLCVSLHQVGGTGTIFGGYFLVPLLAAGSVLLLEISIVGRLPKLQEFAFGLPVAMLAMVAILDNPDLVYQRFEEMFTLALGGSPLFFAALAATAVYGWAAARRVRLAGEALTASLMLFAVVGPTTEGPATTIEPWGAPLLLAAALQLALGLRSWDARRCLAGCVLILAGMTLDLQGTWFTAYRGVIPLHLLLTAVLSLGILFKDPFGRFLQQLGAGMLLGYCLCAMTLGGQVDQWRALPYLYPLFAVALAVVLGYNLRNRLYVAVAAVCASVWLAFSLTQGFGHLRAVLVGLDQIAWGLVFFLLAAAISFWKAGYLRRWPKRLPPETPP